MTPRTHAEETLRDSWAYFWIGEACAGIMTGAVTGNVLNYGWPGIVFAALIGLFLAGGVASVTVPDIWRAQRDIEAEREAELEAAMDRHPSGGAK